MLIVQVNSPENEVFTHILPPWSEVFFNCLRLFFLTSSEDVDGKFVLVGHTCEFFIKIVYKFN